MALCIPLTHALDNPGPPPTSKLPEIPTAYVATDDIPTQSLLDVDEDGSIHAQDVNSPVNHRVNSWRNTQSTAVASHLSFSAESDLIRKSSQYSQPVQHHGNQSNAGSPLVAARDNVLDSPTLPPHLIQPNTDGKLHDMLQTQESLRGHILHKNDSMHSLHTQH